MNKFLVTGISSLAILTGCSSTPEYRLGQFTAASSFNIRNLEYDYETTGRVFGEDCHKVNEQPSNARLQRAMDNAIRDGQDKGVKGDLLVNVRIDQVNKSKPGLLGLPQLHNCIEVEGDLVSIKDNNIKN